MNQATKALWANILTTVVTIIVSIQGVILANSPFTPDTVMVLGAIFTYLTMVLTAWKQYLSPDVSNKGQTVTIWIVAITTIAGLSDLIGLVHLAAKTEEFVKFTISVLVMILNILSKTIFPSFDQKVKMSELKNKQG